MLLAGATLYLLFRPPAGPGMGAEAQLAGALGALDRRVAALEVRPDAAPLADRVSAAERRLAELAGRPQPAAATPDQLAALAARVGTLENRPVATASGAPAATPEQLAAVAQRVAALEARPAPPPPPAPPPAATPEQLAAVAQRVAAIEARPAGADQTARIGALEARMNQLRAATAIGLRLAAGEALGPALTLLPAGTPAPEALRRFAEQAPPTEAGLRRDFPAAVRAAREASTPTTGDATSAVRGFLAGLVTVRRGEEVVLGNGDAVALAAAEARLAIGDLAGAVAALGGLTPGAAQAIAPWSGRAKALLEARAALSGLAS